MMKVLFLHGWGSRPGGLKPTWLSEHGQRVVNPRLPDDDFERCVGIAQDAFDRVRPEVVVGSSRGGAVAVNILRSDVPLVLVAPAWKRWGAATTVREPVVILHSQCDGVVPIEDSRQLLCQSGLADDHLLVVGEDHTMSDIAALGALLEAVRRIGQA